MKGGTVDWRLIEETRQDVVDEEALLKGRFLIGIERDLQREARRLRRTASQTRGREVRFD